MMILGSVPISFPTYLTASLPFSDTPPANRSGIEFPRTNAEASQRGSDQSGRAAQDRSESPKPALDAPEPIRKAASNVELDQDEARELSELKARDREVRAHELAHQAAGAQYAGSASHTYQRGPDGVQYAIGGEAPN